MTEQVLLIIALVLAAGWAVYVLLKPEQVLAWQAWVYRAVLGIDFKFSPRTVTMLRVFSLVFISALVYMGFDALDR